MDQQAKEEKSGDNVVGSSITDRLVATGHADVVKEGHY